MTEIRMTVHWSIIRFGSLDMSLGMSLKLDKWIDWPIFVASVFLWNNVVASRFVLLHKLLPMTVFLASSYAMFEIEIHRIVFFFHSLPNTYYQSKWIDSSFLVKPSIRIRLSLKLVGDLFHLIHQKVMPSPGPLLSYIPHWISSVNVVQLHLSVNAMLIGIYLKASHSLTSSGL